MRLSPPPPAASWVHRDVRTGFEVAFFRTHDTGTRLTGQTTAREASALWSVSYNVELDGAWRTQVVRASALTVAGPQEVMLTRDAVGRWTVDGEPRPELDGCVDVDFESSAVTNTFPIHRLDFVVDQGVDVPATFVRADDLRVERLEQRYTLTTVTNEGSLFHYESSTFDFSCELRYDRAGLVVDYPGIAVRDS